METNLIKDPDGAVSEVNSIQTSGLKEETDARASIASSVATTAVTDRSPLTDPDASSVATTELTDGNANAIATAASETGLTKTIWNIVQGAKDAAEKLERQIRRRERDTKWRVKKCMLLFVFILAMFMAMAGIVKWVIFFKEFTEPPSVYSADSFNHAILAFGALFILAPFGFIVLATRISNMFVGMSFMFCIILVISFAMSSASRAGYSIKYDNLPELKLYYQKVFRDQKKVPQFYNLLQRKCQCCGFEEVNRLKDWPESLQTPNFPEGCCKPAQNKTKGQGDELQRCMGLGRMFNQFRVPSGFSIIMTEDQFEMWRTNFTPLNPRAAFRIANVQNEAGQSESRKLVGEISQELFRVSDDGSNVGEGGVSFFQFLGDLNSARDPTRERLRKGVITGPNELLVELDEFVDELIYREEHSNTRNIMRGEWVAFELPVFEPDENILGNMDPSIEESQAEINYTEPYTISNLKSFYFSRGLLENVVLDQNDLVWGRRCETESETNFFPAGCNNDIGKFQKFVFSLGKDTEGLFVGILKQEMLWEGCLCAGVFAFGFALAVIFWYYYSRLKTEEQIGLAPPTDFDLLNLNLPSYDELDETTKAREQETFKLRQKEQRERIKEEELQRRRVKNVHPFHSNMHLDHKKEPVKPNKPNKPVKPIKSNKGAPEKMLKR